MSITWYKPKTAFSGLVNSCQNDCTTLFDITSSSQWSPNNPPTNAFSWSSQHSAATTTERDGNWIRFALKNNKYFYITHYELKQRNDSSDSLLKSWVFQAFDSKNNVITLDEQNATADFYIQGAEQLFPAKKGIFNSFQLKDQQRYELVIKRIEIYGIICNSYEECQSLFQYKTCKYSTYIHCKIISFTFLLK